MSSAFTAGDPTSSVRGWLTTPVRRLIHRVQRPYYSKLESTLDRITAQLHQTRRELNRTCLELHKVLQLSTVNNKLKNGLDNEPVTLKIFEPTKPNLIPNDPGRGPNRVNSSEPSQGISLPEVCGRTIVVSGNCIGISGYDNLVQETIRGLKSAGADVRINANNRIDYNLCPDWFKNIHVARHPGTWELIIAPPCYLDGPAPGKKSVVLTMWETDYLEPEWVKLLNNAHSVCVPSQWAVESFRKCGVKIPISCVPLGFDPLIFNPDQSFPEVCTFGTAATLTAGGLRKNTQFIIDLFREAFPTQDDVKLKVKISPACPLPNYNDPRVEITREMLPPARLADWYRSLTAFVNVSYAEGFGLHLIESMACGRPLISTHYSAVTEYFDESVGWVIDHEIVPASGGAYSGHWGKPISGSIIDKMRCAYQNSAEVKSKGEAAYLRSKNFTWEIFGNRLAKALKDHGIVDL